MSGEKRTSIGELTVNPRSGFVFYKPSASADGGRTNAEAAIG
jgi:hypothetical protein